MPFLGEADGSLVLLADDWYVPYKEEMMTEMNEAVQRVETYATNISDAVDENTALHRAELETATTKLSIAEDANKMEAAFVVSELFGECPIGYKYVTDYDTCLMAKRHFNKTGHSGVRMMNHMNWSDPGFIGGCFFRYRHESHNLLYFNHREVISTNGTQQEMLVCKRS